jgi:oxalate decarboxylase/phosphoglucose isomerase-like protein (cupin superfamily)
MNDTTVPSAEQRADKGTRLVLQPEDGTAYWQPKPANGYVIVKVSPENCSSNVVTMGIQVVAPDGCYVREHWHSRNEEILFCFEGRGTIIVDGTPHAFVPGTTAYLGRWVKHKIINDGGQPLKFTWTFLPPGLDEFFASIGRPRVAGEPAPDPFERPTETLAIERRTGFGPPVGS